MYWESTCEGSLRARLGTEVKIVRRNAANQHHDCSPILLFGDGERGGEPDHHLMLLEIARNFVDELGEWARAAVDHDRGKYLFQVKIGRGWQRSKDDSLDLWLGVGNGFEEGRSNLGSVVLVEIMPYDNLEHRDTSFLHELLLQSKDRVRG